MNEPTNASVDKDIPMGKMPKRWFEDWELGIMGFDDGTAYVEVHLPHNVPTHYIFPGKKGPEIRNLASLLDKLLSELTGTKVKKVEFDNGPNTHPTHR